MALAPHDRDWDDGAVADGGAVEDEAPDWPSTVAEGGTTLICLPDPLWDTVTYDAIDKMYPHDESPIAKTGTYCRAPRGSAEWEATFQLALKRSDRKLAAIARLLRQEWSRKEVAQKYAVAPSTVTRWCNAIEEFRREWERAQDEMPFQHLPARTQRVARLWFKENRSVSDIASALDVGYATARQEIITVAKAYNAARGPTPELSRAPTTDGRMAGKPLRRDGRHARSAASRAEILDVIRGWPWVHDEPPTQSDILRAINKRSKNHVARHLKTLIEEGLVQLHPDGRGYVVVESSELAPHFPATTAL
jgi:transposase